MGRVLQKKKNKSSLPKAGPRKPKSTSSRRGRVLNNPIVAKNWSSTQTLSQNYHRLGLASKLNTRAGGTEPSSLIPSQTYTHTSSSSSSAPPPPPEKQQQHDPLSLSLAAHTQSSKVLIPGTVRIERDPCTGAIRRVLPPDPSGEEEEGVEEEEKPNPLNDPLNALDDFGAEVGSKEGGWGIVGQLEAEAARMGALAKKKKVQSKFEAEWVGRLVERWGDDVERMARDRKLNPWQQSEGDIRRRIRWWREGGGGNGVVGSS